MIEKLRKWNKRNDSAVSPVIGTILMVAVTVVLVASVYVAVNGFGSKTVKEPSNAAFKVISIDTDNDGKTNVFRCTYLTGPTNVPLADVVVTVQDSTGTAVAPVAAKTTDWNPGDFLLYNPGASGPYFVSVSILGTTVLDQTVTLDA